MVIKISPARDRAVIIDNFKIHFTSRNYFGDYDGLIITAHLFDTIRNMNILHNQKR